MPCTNTSDLSQTFVGLTWEFLGVPSGCYTLFSLSFVDTDDIDHLILGEDGINIDWLLKKASGIINFVAD